MVDKQSSPAFSMGAASPPKKINNHFVPGPGAYESVSSLQVSKQQNSKPSGQRFKLQINNVPGPGTYNYDSNKSHSPHALVVSRTKQRSVSSQEAPGPGSYEPNYRKIVKNQSGYKIGSSVKHADMVGERAKLPGPGNYETNKSTLATDHAVRIGSQKRADFILNKFTPGPGQYQDKNLQQLTLKNNPKIVFGKAGRSFSYGNLIPGPGAYTVSDKLQDSTKSRGFSMSSKVPEPPTFASKVPGPGAYNSSELNLLKSKTSSYSIGKAQRLKVDNEKDILSLPGPEKYNINRGAFEHAKVAFGKEKRNSPYKESNIPGPGAYESRVQSTLPQFSIPKSNSSWIKATSTPGPGTYQAKINESNYHSIKIKQDERKPFYDQKKWVPGPGSYSNERPIDKAIGYKIGTEKRGEIKGSTNPGPGNYNIPSTVSNIPKYSHPQRI